MALYILSANYGRVLGQFNYKDH